MPETSKHADGANVHGICEPENSNNVEHNVSKDDAQVALVITVFDVEPRVHLISGLGKTELVAFCSFGIREIAAGGFYEGKGTHVVATHRALR